MNKKKYFFLFFLCLLFTSARIYADDEAADQQLTVQDQQSGSAPVVVDITQLLNQQQQTSYDVEEDPIQVEVIEPELVNVTTSLQRVSASDTTGLKSILLSILGDYETVVTDYEYRNNNNTYYSHSIAIERDYAWLCSCGIFAIILYCTFRSIGGILCRT